MLRKIEIDGYKSIDHQTMELKKFNLLAGINSAGKSSVIQSITITWQAICNCLKGTMRLNGGRFSDMRNSVKGNRDIRFCLTAENDAGELCRTELQMFRREERDSFRIGPNLEENWKAYTEQYQLIYLPVERVGVQDSYAMNTEDPFAIGSRGQYAYAYLAQHGQDPLREKEFLYRAEEVGMSLNNQVNYWLEYLLGFHVQVNTIPDLDQVVATFSNAKDKRYYRTRNVGTGVSFMTILLITALSCHKGDTLIVENPEIHLHPRAQSRFMECIAYLSKRGLQVILETHSDHIYNGLRKCIKKKQLTTEDVAAYYLELDDTLQTTVSEIHFNGEGAEENHPYGMFDQFDDDLDELLGL